jgi:hypothetical protein
VPTFLIVKKQWVTDIKRKELLFLTGQAARNAAKVAGLH